MNREVVVTGAGALTPLGATLAETRAAFLAGRRGIGPCRAFDASPFASADAGEVPGFDPRDHFRATKALKVADRRSRLAVAAASMALASAGWHAETGDRLGVLVGTSTFDLQMAKLAAAVFPDAARATQEIPFFAERALSGVTPLWLLTVLPNMASSHVGMQLSASGPNSTIMSDAAAGLQAIGEAADWIRRGECDAALAGGADTIVTPAAFAAAAQDGRGVPPAEGAAMLMLEDAESAGRRGAPVAGRVRGYATATGACAESRAIGAALRESGWTARDIDGVCGPDVDRIDGFDPGARRLSILAAMGDTVAAASPAALAIALGGGFGTRVLCVAPAGIGPAAALAIEMVTQLP